MNDVRITTGDGHEVGPEDWVYGIFADAEHFGMQVHKVRAGQYTQTWGVFADRQRAMDAADRIHAEACAAVTRSLVSANRVSRYGLF